MNTKLTILFLAMTLQATAQAVRPNVQDPSKWNLINRKAEAFTEKDKKGVTLSEAQNDGMMVLRDFSFSNGTIEFDVKGRNVPQQSFVGIAFHLGQGDAFDAIYFRPFNFMNVDTVRRSRSIQYVSMPAHPWEKLRAEHPGKYENKVNPVPNADEWFHAKVTIEGKRVRVFVNNSTKPSLEVEKLSPTVNSAIALWVGNGSNGSFANLVITPSK